MLENKAHLIFVLLLREDLGGVWDGSDFLSNLPVAILKLRSGLTNIFLDFLFNRHKFGIVLLNVQSVLQLVDFWDLCDDLALLFLEVLDHFSVHLGWLVLLEHLIDSLLDDAGLLGEVLLQSVHVFLDVLQLGHGEGAAHFALLSIPDTLIELHLELAYQVLIGLHEASKFLLLFNKSLILSDIVLVNERRQLELAEVLLLNSLAVIQKQCDCHQFNNGLHYFLINYNLLYFFIIVNFIHLIITEGFCALGHLP